MAKVEIDEAELAQAQRAIALLERLNGSQKARPLLEKAVKAEFPDVVTQEEQVSELAKPYIEKISALEAKLEERFARDDEERQKARERAADAELFGAFKRLEDQGYTQEGMAKIATLMKERHIPDPEAAAALFDRMNPKPVEVQPSAWEPARWNIESDAVVDTQKLFENPDKWADLETGKILSDLRSQRAA